MNDTNSWFVDNRSRADAISRAFHLKMRRLWWANLFLVVVPAVFATAAAIVAADRTTPQVALYLFSMPAASALAGSAAVLTAIHKALKCEEYQAECLRLGQEYESLAVSLDSALHGPESQREEQRLLLTSKLAKLSRTAKARVPSDIARAEAPAGA